jgi:ergothioneine biosynthesis protein EgtB
MTLSFPAPDRTAQESQQERYHHIRKASTDLVAPLMVEDMMVQSMPDASPTRWHLAHTTWFFEYFLLAANLPDYRPYQQGWDHLFNSYYYSVGDMYQRAARGLLSRPTVAEILSYRVHVDHFISELISIRRDDSKFCFLLELGLNHEQQHQELILTDIKHALSLNPLRPTYRKDLQLPATTCTAMDFIDCKGGIVEIGADSTAFCFDNETPRHPILLQDFRLGSRLVSNAEYREFIDDGGYQRSEWWLSDGWATIRSRNWNRPIYWAADLDSEFSLLGEIELDPNRCVSHVSYYEADAYARWAGARLPSEAEWEHVAARQTVRGNLLEARHFHPAGAEPDAAISQLFGDTWEWTQSPYSAYPGFRPLAGSLGEYNGKFMCNQMVLRGGSCVTPAGHVRASYRNFFYPDARWQFSGIRLVMDN